MRKGTVLSLKNFRFAEFIAKNNILVILVLLFIAGIIFGIFSEQKISFISDYASSYLDGFISERTGASFFSVMLESFMSSCAVLLVIFASGTSMLGVLLVPFAAVLRAVLYGAVSAVLYSQYSVKGIAFNTVLIVPSALIFIFSLLLAARESVKFSAIILKISFPGTQAVNLSFDFKNYCGRYLFILLIALLSAIIDAVLSCSFIAGLNI